MKIFLLFIIVFAFTASHSYGSQYKFIGDITRYSLEQNLLKIICDNAQVEISVVADAIFRVRMYPGKIPETHSYAALPSMIQSSAFMLDETESHLKIVTDHLILSIQKSPCRLTFMDTRGNIVCKDHDSYGMGWNNSKIFCWKELHEEPFFGLGEKTRGLNKRGNVYTMWNSDIPGYTSVTDPIYQSHPFFLSIHNGLGFGIFFDNTYRSEFNLGAGTDQFYSFGADDGVMDYYLIFGPELKNVISRYGGLVGTLPLPPKWSLGYQQCRWSYYPEKEVMELAEKFRDKEIPCDAIYLDIHYMDGYRCFTWHPERFPEPKKMITKLKEMGFKVVIIIDPGIKVDPTYLVYQQGIQGDFFCKYPDGTQYQGTVWPGNCHFPDFSDPDAGTWWGNLYENHIEEGIAGFWNDMNEPAAWGGTFPDIVRFSDEGRGADHLKMHNLYGALMVKASYEGVKKLNPEQRPFILTRAGYAGVQRYAAVWTGDNAATWDHLRLAVRMCLGLSVSGVSFCGSDIGGFMGSPTPELFTRWLQFSVFTPLFRSHTVIDTPDQEPWSFGDRHERINREYIRLRYQLMPYIYNAMYEAAVHAAPAMRPMFYDYQDDESALFLEEQFMFGGDLLIAPVCYENHENKKIYFPKGVWYDFQTGARFEGPSETLVASPLEMLPIFAKGGAIIPMQHVMNYINEIPSDPLILNIFPEDGMYERSLYEDDGESFEYKEGVHCLTNYELNVSEHSLTLETKKRRGKYTLARRSYLLKLNTIYKIPQKVELNSIAIKKIDSYLKLFTTRFGWFLDEEHHILFVRYPDSGMRMQLNVLF